MIKHVVMWKLCDTAEGNTMEENRKIMSDRLYALVGVIPEIKSMKIYFDTSCTDMSMDIMLDTEFENAEALHTYAVHPKHVAVAEFVKKVVVRRVVLDCEI